MARQLRARDPSIQILFISGHPDDLPEGVRRDLGPVETLDKPLDTGRVVSWVQMAVKRSSGRERRRPIRSLVRLGPPAVRLADGEPETRAQALHTQVRLQNVGVDPDDPFASSDLDESREELAAHPASLPGVGDQQRELRPGRATRSRLKRPTATTVLSPPGGWRSATSASSRS